MKKGYQTCSQCFYGIQNDYCKNTECYICPLNYYTGMEEDYIRENDLIACWCNLTEDGEECSYYREKQIESKGICCMNESILTYRFTAGTKAIDNYDRCCDLFGFKRHLRGSFASQKPLYAKNATQEGYSVWMLAHSSLNESYIQFRSSGRRWYNKFIDGDTIKEIWLNCSEYVEDNTIRITFAKSKQGNYVFQGVYKPIGAGWEDLNTGRKEWVRTFKRISKVYPFENDTEIKNTGDFVVDKPLIIPKVKSTVEISNVIDKCQIKAIILETKKDTTVHVDITLRPFQKALIGKKKGDIFSLPNVKLTYEIQKILIEE